MHAIVLALLMMVACGRDAAPPPPPPAKQPAPAPAAKPRPRVAFVFTKALAETSISDEMLLARVQAQYTPGLRRCYGEELARQPDAAGKVVLKFSVAPAGATTKVDVSGPAAACIQHEVEGWTFQPPMKDGAAVEAPFMLKLALSSTL